VWQGHERRIRQDLAGTRLTVKSFGARGGWWAGQDVANEINRSAQ